jgi:hypothetical protein
MLVAIDVSIIQLYLGVLGILWASKAVTTILSESKSSSSKIESTSEEDKK